MAPLNYPKPSTILMSEWILYTPEIQETNIKSTVKKKIGQSENGKLRINSQKSGTVTQSIKNTESHSQFKTAYYEWRRDGYSSSILNFAPNIL